MWLCKRTLRHRKWAKNAKVVCFKGVRWDNETLRQSSSILYGHEIKVPHLMRINLIVAGYPL